MIYLFKLTMIVLLLLSSNVYAVGWSSYGKITEFNQQPPGQADIILTVDVASNPTTCGVKNKFLIDVETKKDERLYSLLLAAFMSGKEVKLFIEDGCPVWNMPKITGAYVR
ncbi:hypothetical protein [uncultured Shewanella sp.]|uniref:hypothetical protein n=1 Tax=uncultured Shewanella sp. TaxID=173975 RepID=UPI00260D1DD1|nr:hypothetical protein [uncultured Shewanella sp.]